jgi:hypothetical protein
MLELKGADADTIFETAEASLMEIFDGDAEEMHSRLFANGSDGCASLTGRKKGAMTQFKRKQPQQLFSHCSGHKLALVASDAADSVEGICVGLLRELSQLSAWFELVCCRSSWRWCWGLRRCGTTR